MCRRTAKVQSIQMAQITSPKRSLDPVVTATHLCTALVTLEQAAAAAGFCEAVCQDMVATVSCRGRQLLSMLIALEGVPQGGCLFLSCYPCATRAATTRPFRLLSCAPQKGR